MTDLRQYARGKQCSIRVPEYCNFNPETTVWCHIRLIGVSGFGIKAPDVLGAFGCSACHDVVDGRTKTDYTHAELRLMHLEGMARSQAWLVSEEILRW